ncbi:MAG: hypothetical protein ACRCYU_09460 [Nocardioides sp.]
MGRLGNDNDRQRGTTPEPPSQYAPLEYDAVRGLADDVAATLGSAMICPKPSPLAEAAWQAGLALQRVAEALATDGLESVQPLSSLAHHGECIRRAAHEMLAAQPPDHLAQQIQQQAQKAHGLHTVIHEATLTVTLPNGEDVRIAVTPPTQESTHDLASWEVGGDTPLAAPDPLAHLEISSTMATLADLIDAALNQQNSG